MCLYWFVSPCRVHKRIVFTCICSCLSSCTSSLLSELSIHDEVVETVSYLLEPCLHDNKMAYFFTFSNVWPLIILFSYSSVIELL